MNVLIYPIGTEKAMNLIEKNNTITYVVDMRSTKKEIKEEFEKRFNVKVEKVNTVIGKVKKAYIKLEKGFNARDIAIKLKLV